MLPLLKLLADGREYPMGDLTEKLSNEFSLSEDDRSVLLPSGRQRTITSRTGWARTYMKKAGLVESPSRGNIRITDTGASVLRENPPKIDDQYLSRFPSFRDFKKGSVHQAIFEEKEYATPEEILDFQYRKLRSDMNAEVISQLLSCSPRFFEKIVLDVLVAMGYGGSHEDAARKVGRTGDGGIDGIIKEDKLGLDTIYLQAKRWKGSVGRPEVQAFAGALEGVRAKKGIFITTSTFTADAVSYVSGIEKKIVLISGKELADMMIDYNVGVSPIISYTLKKN